MSRGTRLILMVLAVSLPFGVAAFFLKGDDAAACRMALPLVGAMGLLWGLWRGLLLSRQVLPPVPIFGGIVLGDHAHGALVTAEKYIAAMMLASLATLALERLRRRHQ